MPKTRSSHFFRVKREPQERERERRRRRLTRRTKTKIEAHRDETKNEIEAHQLHILEEEKSLNYTEEGTKKKKWNKNIFPTSIQPPCFHHHHCEVTLKNNSEFLLSAESMQSKSKESSINEEVSFPVRKLEISDKRKGFIDLLQQLTVCDSVSDKEFEGRFQELSLYGDDHLVCVIEDNCSGKIVATGSMFIEKKFARNCGQVGHIEDVVVDSNARGMQLGKKIIAFLLDHARSMGCYKVILDCSANNKVFYEKCGFKQKEIQMVKYFT